MLKNRIIPVAIAELVAVLLSARFGWAQGEPASGFYQITSGQYIACCGIGGPFIDVLPDARQAFVALTVDSQRGSAQMAFLAEDMQTVFRSFSNGMVFPDHIQFVSAPGVIGRPPSWNYTVSNAAGALRINGTLFDGPICCDIPNKFTHTNVVAVLIPGAV